MNRILVWDSPTRILHWLFAGSLTVALVLGFAVDDEHPLFAYHMLSGLAAGFFLAVRLVLGFVGSRHARFAAWAWSPRALASYLSGLFRRGSRQYVSHNPASTWVTLAMFVVVALLVGTGVFAAGKPAKEVHEVLAALLVGTIVAHLLGLAWHTLRHRENIALSMVHGRKEAPPEAALASSHRWAGLLVGAVAAAWAVALVRGYDAPARRVQLPLTTITIELGETPGPSSHHDRPARRRHHD